MNRNNFEQIQELDEEDQITSLIPKDRKKFTYTTPTQDKKSEEEFTSNETNSNLSNNENQQFLKQNHKPSDNMFSYQMNKKDNILKQMNQDIIINEEQDGQQDYDYKLSGRDEFFKDIQKSYTKDFIRGNQSSGKKEKPKFTIPKDRLDVYEEIKNQSKINIYALANAPRNKKPNSENYKAIISDHMKILEKELELEQKNEGNYKEDNINKMISTDIETQIRDHIINHKIRANQKYQVVKNFFRIWFINAKEIRRLEKKTQQNTNNQMVADKILQEEQEVRQKKKYLNEKSFSVGETSKKQVKKVKATQVGQKYIKPNYDIKLFIPYCTDIYLGRD